MSTNPPTPEQPNGVPRYQRGIRDQVQIEMRSLDEMLSRDHAARIIWEFVQKLDLSDYYAQILAVEGHVGRSPVDPAILLSLWLLAITEGIGSARELSRLCEAHIAYEWLCGGVKVNYHLLSDFRSSHPEHLEKLIVQILAALMQQGLISLSRVAQDGMRVRANAGSSSFRREGRLNEFLKEAQDQVDALKNQSDEDPGAADRRVKAARERAAREREERIKNALEQVKKQAEKMERRKKGDGKHARCSTTDPDARRMRMADGGTRPAYNVQLATTDETRMIVGWDVTNVGSDAGLMSPMTEQIAANFDEHPREYLTDGGFSTKPDIESLQSQQTTVYTPVKEEDAKRQKGEDPFAPRKGDTPVIAAWRQRMGTLEVQEIYKKRSSIAEFPNAVFRNRGLRQFLVRGLEKVRSTMLWQVFAFNFTRMRTLGWLERL